MTPEAQARLLIDQKLAAAGWRAQAVIVEVVRDALSSSEDQLQAINKALRKTAAQSKNILQAAFSGQPVPQDPRDEPASALLERVRAERMNQPATSRKPRVARKAR